MKYIVTVRETHAAKYEVEANSPDEARMKVHQGKGDYIDGTTEYVELQNNFLKWEVEEDGPKLDPETVARVKKLSREQAVELLEAHEYVCLDRDTIDELRAEIYKSISAGILTLPEE
jgi:hypothetical protein